MIVGIKYCLFAFVSIACNMLAQLIILSLVHYIYLALFIGTGVGFFVKYFLDKKYIFYYETSDINQSIKNIFKYLLTSIFTTVIFWSFELFFYSYFGGWLTYIGGAIGLIIGFIIKYKLDKKKVFL